jgi:hypothetical protein
MPNQAQELHITGEEGRGAHPWSAWIVDEIEDMLIAAYRLMPYDKQYLMYLM